MKTPTLCAALIAVVLPTLAMAGPVERACMRSDRASANSQVCSCIQRAADATLSGSEQRRAARFFADPDQAQTTRVSRSNSDNAFWTRYRAFGQAAQAYCG